MRQMLQEAQAGGYAAGAFNILDHDSVVKTVVFCGYAPIMQWYRQPAGAASVRIAIQMDHAMTWL